MHQTVRLKVINRDLPPMPAPRRLVAVDRPKVHSENAAQICSAQARRVRAFPPRAFAFSLLPNLADSARARHFSQP